MIVLQFLLSSVGITGLIAGCALLTGDKKIIAVTLIIIGIVAVITAKLI